MVRLYKTEDKEPLCDFFISLLKKHPAYISHGEIQMGVATDSGVLADNHREIWRRYLENQTANPDNRLYVYEHDERLAGFILAGITSDGAAPYGVIFDLGVDEKLRGHGIGQQLTDQAFGWLRSQGITDCYLESGVENHAAHNFFEARGFKVVSHIFKCRI